MNGIYLINEKVKLNGLTLQESIQLQKEALMAYIQEQKIKVTKLNPYQLHDHYSIPHALYYDLKSKRKQLDCLMIYSPQIIEDYMTTYPARWLMLKSFFDRVIMVQQYASQVQ
ncbi:MAG: hypothetical protein Q8935_02270 [Bacillota bacterium]|jgi:hypothetical protein|nr:hypothetical protein [Bacillota bacterium]MDP4155090.1 hypothetical protein [Bacillota bacterium]